MSTISNNGLKITSSKNLEMQKPRRTPCEAFRIDRKVSNEKPKSMIIDENSKHHNDLDQFKLQERICKLDKLGKTIQSLPGKQILDKNTYGRLKNAAVVVTAAEKRMAIQQRIANEERLKTESEIRKEQLQKFNMYQTKGPKLAQVSD